MNADVNQLMQMMQADPSLAADPSMGMPPTTPGMPIDPMMSDPMMAPGLGAAPGAIGPPMPASPFPSTDPGMLAQVVQDALAQLADQDHMSLEMQQQQAAMQAQPLIDQMMMQAAMPAPDPMMGGMGAPDPMMAFGEQDGMPPLPPEEMVA